MTGEQSEQILPFLFADPTQSHLNAKSFFHVFSIHRGAEFLFKGMPLKYYLVVGESEVRRVCLVRSSHNNIFSYRQQHESI